MKNILKILLTYVSVFTIFTTLYLLMFNTQLFAFQKVLFYRGITLLIVNFFIFLFIAIFVNKKFKSNFETLLAAIIVSASINLSLFVVLPVTFERSVTMYLLRSLNENRINSCGGLTKEQLEEKLINQYIIKNKAIDKRINEQELINFISNNQCVSITKKAKNFLNLSEIIERIYNIK
jgi:hypothetical protein